MGYFGYSCVFNEKSFDSDCDDNAANQKGATDTCDSDALVFAVYWHRARKWPSGSDALHFQCGLLVNTFAFKLRKASIQGAIAINSLLRLI